jgi:hypothetical protein
MDITKILKWHPARKYFNYCLYRLLPGKKQNKNIKIKYERFTRHALKKCNEFADNELLFLPHKDSVKDLLESKKRPNYIELKTSEFDPHIGYILFRPDVSVKIDTLAYLNYSVESISELIIDKYGDEVYSPTVIDNYLYFFFNLRHKGYWNPWIIGNVLEYTTNDVFAKHYSILHKIYEEQLSLDEALLTLGFKIPNNSKTNILTTSQLVSIKLLRSFAKGDMDASRFYLNSTKKLTDIIQKMGYSELENPLADTKIAKGIDVNAFGGLWEMIPLDCGVTINTHKDGTTTMFSKAQPNGVVITNEQAEAFKKAWSDILETGVEVDAIESSREK